MDAKEAIKLLKGEPVFLNDFPEVKRKQAARLAVSALEKVEKLETENARLKVVNNRFYEDMTLYKRQIDKLVDLKESLYAENARLREKETPKALNMNGDWLSCPTCGCNLAGSIPNYCRECGQRFKNFKAIKNDKE